MSQNVMMIFIIIVIIILFYCLYHHYFNKSSKSISRLLRNKLNGGDMMDENTFNTTYHWVYNNYVNSLSNNYVNSLSNDSKTKLDNSDMYGWKIHISRPYQNAYQLYVHVYQTMKYYPNTAWKVLPSFDERLITSFHLNDIQNHDYTLPTLYEKSNYLARYNKLIEIIDEFIYRHTNCHWTKRMRYGKERVIKSIELYLNQRDSYMNTHPEMIQDDDSLIEFMNNNYVNSLSNIPKNDHNFSNVTELKTCVIRLNNIIGLYQYPEFRKPSGIYMYDLNDRNDFNVLSELYHEYNDTFNAMQYYKFIAIYPNNDDEARKIADTFHFDGSFSNVLFDFKISNGLFTRFTNFTGQENEISRLCPGMFDIDHVNNRNHPFKSLEYLNVELPKDVTKINEFIRNTWPKFDAINILK